MSPLIPVREDLVSHLRYDSPQIPAEVRLNSNESPLAPPPGWAEAFEAEVARVEANRYPDPDAAALRAAIGALHGVCEKEVFCANGSNEVVQCLLLAFGGPGRRAALFEPTYALHRLIATVSGTTIVAAKRNERFEVDLDRAQRLFEEHRPELTFLCSPNNPTANADPLEVIAAMVHAVPGLLVVDEAYGELAPTSATSLRRKPGSEGLAVVRTFSKAWALAAARLGYVIAAPEVIEACRAVALPYHLSAYTQAAGIVSLRFAQAMSERVAVMIEERERVAAGLEALPVELWPSDANFILFRPKLAHGARVFGDLVERSVLVRDFSRSEDLSGCLRVTIGTRAENDRFLSALEECLS
ncbi:MAG: histidinol-phosphate transaminase [Acidimicrobiales bacterium]